MSEHYPGGHQTQDCPARADSVILRIRTPQVKPGSMEIELRGGRVTVRGAVDRAVLRVVITMLQR